MLFPICPSPFHSVARVARNRESGAAVILVAMITWSWSVAQLQHTPYCISGPFSRFLCSLGIVPILCAVLQFLAMFLEDSQSLFIVLTAVNTTHFNVLISHRGFVIILSLSFD